MDRLKLSASAAKQGNKSGPECDADICLNCQIKIVLSIPWSLTASSIKDVAEVHPTVIKTKKKRSNSNESGAVHSQRLSGRASFIHRSLQRYSKEDGGCLKIG